MNEITTRPEGPMAVLADPGRSLTASDVRAHVNLIQEVMKGVMKENTHYGVIPGCKQPSLYKAGSEVLLTTFRIAVVPEVQDLSTPDMIRYRVHAKGVHQQTGIVIGTGIGECSTAEDKYKWRAAICPEEFEATPENRRRVKYAKTKGGGFYTTKQVRTEPADLANTVLKMAKKRAQIDLTLTGTAASDIFTQDIEDLPEELRPAEQEGAPAGRPQITAYPATEFAKNLPGWQRAIAEGKYTAERIISMVSTKGTLTEEQKAKIKAKTTEGEAG